MNWKVCFKNMELPVRFLNGYKITSCCVPDCIRFESFEDEETIVIIPTDSILYVESNKEN